MDSAVRKRLELSVLDDVTVTGTRAGGRVQRLRYTVRGMLEQPNVTRQFTTLRLRSDLVPVWCMCVLCSFALVPLCSLCVCSFACVFVC